MGHYIKLATNSALGRTHGCTQDNRDESLPSFFIVGPPRTGTSWLHQTLSKCTLLPRLTKETRFFDIHFHRGLNWYRAHYRRFVNGRRIGEVAPTYFASSRARERIARTVPDAKVVCIFRNPVDRILSLYKVKRAYGMIPWSLEQAIVRDPELMESGKYATNLKAWQQMLGKNRILPTIYDDLLGQPQSYIDALADFIDIPRFTLTSAQIRHIHASDVLTNPWSYHFTRFSRVMAEWFKAQNLDMLVAAVRNSPLMPLLVGSGPAFAETSLQTSQWLYRHFQPEVEELEAILNRDFSTWKSLGPGMESISEAA